MITLRKVDWGGSAARYSPGTVTFAINVEDIVSVTADYVDRVGDCSKVFARGVGEIVVKNAFKEVMDMIKGEDPDD